MSAAEVLYSFGVKYPDVLERERQHILKMPAYRDGGPIAPSSGSLTIYKPGQTTSPLVDAAAVTVTNNVAQYTLSSATLSSSVAFGDGYMQVWALVMPDSTTRHVRREMAVCKYELHPVVSDRDLIDEYPELPEMLGLPTLQGFLDRAWGRILRRLITRGVMSQRITSPDALYDWHLNLALFYAFKAAYRGQQADRWQALFELHRTEANAAYGEMNFTEDADDDGLPDDTSRKSAGTVLHINAAPTAYQRGPSTRW
jgi:hypothetical protein